MGDGEVAHRFGIRVGAARRMEGDGRRWRKAMGMEGDGWRVIEGHRRREKAPPAAEPRSRTRARPPRRVRGRRPRSAAGRLIKKGEVGDEGRWEVGYEKLGR